MSEYSGTFSSINEAPTKQPICYGVNLSLSLLEWQELINLLIQKHGTNTIAYISGGPYEAEFLIKDSKQ